MVLLAGDNKGILHTHTHKHTHSTQISINIYPVTQRHKNRDAAAVGPLKGAQRRRTNPVPVPVPGPGPCSDPVHRRCRFPFQHAWTIADDSEHALPSRSHSRSMLSFPTKTFALAHASRSSCRLGHATGRQAGKRSLSLPLSLAHTCACVRLCVCACA